MRGGLLRRRARRTLGREPEPELRGERRPVAHRVDGEAHQRHARLAILDESLDRGLVDVVLELGVADRDGDDLVHALAVHLVDQPGRVGRDHGDRHGASELTGRRDELERDVANLPPDVLGDDQDAHRSLSSISCLIRPATSAGSLPSISAPSPFGGTNIRVTRAAGSPRSTARRPRSPSAPPA